MRRLVTLWVALASLVLAGPATLVSAAPFEEQFVRILRGSAGYETLDGIAVAPDHSVYIVGATHGPTFFGNATAGAADVYVAKLSAGGKVIWARLLQGTADEFPAAAAAGPDNSVYVVGYSVSPTFDGFTNRGDYDAFVAKFDSDGDRLWLKILGGSGQEYATGVVVLPNGDIAVAGTTHSASFHKLTTDGGDGFVAWFHPDGKRTRLKLVQGASDESIEGMTALADGSVAVAGSTHDEGDPNSDYDAFVARYSKTGTLLWGHASSFEADQYVSDIVAAKGGLYVTGYESAAGRVTHSDVLLIRLTPAGETSWKKVYTGPKLDNGWAIAVAGDSLYVAGIGDRSNPVHNALGEIFYPDAMLLRVGLGGGFQSVRYFSDKTHGDRSDAATAIAAANGTIYLGGDTAGPVFEGKRAGKDSDAFIVALK